MATTNVTHVTDDNQKPFDDLESTGSATTTATRSTTSTDSTDFVDRWRSTNKRTKADAFTLEVQP